MAGRKVPPPPLCPKAALILEILIETPPHRAVPTPQLLEELNSRGHNTSESTFSRHLLPKLRLWGVVNKPRAGYFVSPAGRENFIRLLTAHHALMTAKGASDMMRPQ